MKNGNVGSVTAGPRRASEGGARQDRGRDSDRDHRDRDRDRDSLRQPPAPQSSPRCCRPLSRRRTRERGCLLYTSPSPRDRG
eukprot:860206-Rhodomonas_salina.1